LKQKGDAAGYSNGITFLWVDNSAPVRMPFSRHRFAASVSTELTVFFFSNPPKPLHAWTLRVCVGGNMGKGEHISMQTLIKICETLNCDIADLIALVPDESP